MGWDISLEGGDNERETMREMEKEMEMELPL
jgi:hypothetical protein